MNISVQVLDGMYGRTAVGAQVHLERMTDTGWEKVANAETKGDGRIGDWEGRSLESGLYRVVVNSDSYFAFFGASTVYPEVVVIFRIRNGFDTYQIQITLSPFSYSTHFGWRSADDGYSPAGSGS